MKGAEILADAIDPKSQTPITAYLAILFDDEGGYFILTGLVGSELAKECVGDFKEMTRSLKRREPAPSTP
jgi:hypothetical protein